MESCLAMVYWTNWNPQAASIQRAYITGYGLESIITTDIRMPNTITLDYENHKLYWADARLDKIERADYDGTHRVVLAHSTPKHPFAMAVHQNYLYWTDWVLRAVLRANKFSGADVVWLRKDIGRLMGIMVVQNTTQDCSANPCSILNGQCEDICSLVGGQIKCECTQGRLAADGKRCLPSGQCQMGQFMCTSKDCIPYHLTCDTISHCIDGSDEDIIFCNYRQCPNNYFMCKNRRCIPLNQTCDGIQHCGDGSDEAVCNCTDDHFKCSSGQCIEKKYQCDGAEDCPDSSDEMNCSPRECIHRPDTFGNVTLIQCANTSLCYMESWRCDKQDDCGDNSDEMNCPNNTCNADQFACTSGECINFPWRCDNEQDCTDGSDELDCYKNNGSETTCRPNYFKCANNSNCIPDNWQCDGYSDCVDGSDEGEHCMKRKCTGSTFHCPNGRCISLTWRCDGDADCDGGEDERDCESDVTKECPDSMFTCLNRQCIDQAYFCNGVPECSDGSDEYPKCKPSLISTPQCEPGQFRCENGQCLPDTVMCNLSIDCTDGSDENVALCSNSTLICAAPEFYRCGK